MQIEDGVLQITKASNGKFVSKIENYNFGPKDHNFLNYLNLKFYIVHDALASIQY